MDQFFHFLLAGFGIVAALIALYLVFAHPDAFATEMRSIGGVATPFVAQLQGNPGH